MFYVCVREIVDVGEGVVVGREEKGRTRKKKKKDKKTYALRDEVGEGEGGVLCTLQQSICLHCYPLN